MDLIVYSIGVIIVILIHIYMILRNKTKHNQLILEKELEVTRTVRLSKKIIEIKNRMMEIDERDVLLELILEKAIEVIDNAERGSIMFIRQDGNCEYVASVGYDLNKLKEVTFNIEDTGIYHKTNGKCDSSCIIDDIMMFNKEVDFKKNRIEKLIDANVINIHTTISAPIFVENKVYGFINLDSNKENAFSNSDLSITDVFVGEAGMAIKSHLMLKEIIHLSRYDSLTGIYNRRYFEDILEQSIKKANRYKEKFSVVIFDLNGLKKINDTYGHLAGDGLITYFTDKMKKNIRESDVFARYGGDEFAGVFYESDIDKLKEGLEDMLIWFSENLYQFDSHLIKCSFSYGISEFGKDTTQYDELIKTADDRMYKYKRGMNFPGK